MARNYIKTKKGKILRDDLIFWEDIYLQYLNGASIQELAKELNISWGCLKDQFLRLKYTFKNPILISSEANKKRETLFLAEYGVTNAGSIPSGIEKRLAKYKLLSQEEKNELQEKAAQTSLLRYGFRVATQSDKIKDKISKTKLNYTPEQNLEINKKREQTVFNKYGEKNIGQVETIKQQIKKTRANMDLSLIIAKLKLTWKTKTKQDFANILDKRKQTNLNKFGVEHHFQNTEVLATLQTNLMSKYGVVNVSQVPEFKDKIKASLILKKYKKIEVILEKYKYSLLEEYTGLHTLENKKHLCWKKYKLKHLPCGQEFEDDLFQLPRCPKCFKMEVQKSLLESDFSEYVKNLNVPVLENAKVLQYFNTNLKRNISKEIDIFLPRHNVGFEVNGLIYHSVHPLLLNGCTPSCASKNPTYQKEKTELALVHNIQLYHIWEHFDEAIVKSKIKSILNLNPKYYARKLSFKPISNILAFRFLNENHLYGGTKSLMSFGLFTPTMELISVLTYRRPFKNNNTNILELARFATILNLNIVGGFSKLFINSIPYLKEKNIDKILTYADRDWSPDYTNTVYYKLGFTFLGDTGPSMFYTNFKTVWSRQKFQKHRLKEIYPDIFAEELTEKEILALVKIYPMYTSGNWKFEITI